MNSGKRISAWWNSLLCWLFGHSLTTICTRCGKFVDLEGTKRLTLEERINRYFSKTKKGKEFKGSLKLVPGMKKYSINLKTNELREVDYSEDLNLMDNKKIREAKYDPFCVYIDAVNDNNAIRKANNYIRGVKRGVVITYVSTHDPKDKGIKVKL
jgi:hypothetical protein